MTLFRSFALAALLMGTISLPALAQGPAAPAAKPATTVQAPMHKIAGTTDPAKPAIAKTDAGKSEPGKMDPKAAAKPATPGAAQTQGAAAGTATGGTTMGSAAVKSPTAPAIKTN